MRKWWECHYNCHNHHDRPSRSHGILILLYTQCLCTFALLLGLIITQCFPAPRPARFGKVRRTCGFHEHEPGSRDGYQGECAVQSKPVHSSFYFHIKSYVFTIPSTIICCGLPAQNLLRLCSTGKPNISKGKSIYNETADYVELLTQIESYSDLDS